MYGHLTRMDNDGKTKEVFEARTERRRKWRRLRKDWEEDTGEISKDRGTELTTLNKMAEDRNQHKK